MKVNVLAGFFFVAAVSFCFSLKAEEVDITDSKPSTLNDHEKAIFSKGRISGTRRIVGGILGSTIGFGIGHGVAHQYSEMGWVFTSGELGCLIISLAAVSNSNGAMETTKKTSTPVRSIAIGGLVGVGIFKVWEIFDIWNRPINHNSKFDEVQNKLNALSDLRLIIVPPLGKSAALAGLQLQF